ncbi:EAL domain-containing protein [Pseudohaliea sp.]|uniref:EAL domain-containing protein n=1 Tax=Pseudohaliea sp. TaxID=2740289 RepID=UPI0032EDF21F
MSAPSDGGGSADAQKHAGDRKVTDPVTHKVEELLEDLHQHQQELEAQNEELRGKQALAEQATRRFTALFRSLPLPALVIDDVGVILDSNELAEAQFELGRANLRSHFFPRFLQPEGQRKLRRAIAGAQQAGTDEIARVSLRGPADAGETIDLHVALLEADTGTATRYAVLIVDQTALTRERDSAERARAEAVRLNRAYAMLSHCNRLIIKAREEGPLRDELCRLLVKFGGYGAATIVERTGDGFRTSAGDGRLVSEDQLDRVPLPEEVLRDLRRGTQSVVIDDLALGVSGAVWQATALRYGLRTLAAFPIATGPDDFLGALLIWARLPGSVESAERKLLDQLAGDLAWGLHGLRLRRAIDETERRLETLLESANTVLWEWRPQDDFLLLDHRWPQLRGEAAPTPDHPPLRWEQLLPAHDKVRLEDAVRRLAPERQHGVFSLEHEVRLKDDGAAWVLNRGRVIERDPEHGPRRIIGTLVDITEKHRAERELRLAASVFDNAREGILIANTKGRIISSNQALSRITGYAREQLLGRELASLAAAEDGGEAMRNTLEREGAWSGEVSGRRPDGDSFSALVTVSTVNDRRDQALHYVALFADIAELKAQQARLSFLAQHDALTGLPNRALLADRLEQAMALARRQERLLAIAYLDLDDFKPVNDRYGHEVGDQLLLDLARRMNAILRYSDTLARLGGDEFVIVLTDVADPGAISKLVTRLLNEVSRPALIAGHQVRVEASIGLRFYSVEDHGTDAEQLLRQADQAMYQAKQRGKGRYEVFDSATARTARARHQELEELRRGLARGEFELRYQPQVNMCSGELLGVEALLRWCHPERGETAPDAFMPLVESDELAIDVGRWVIASALEQQRRWRSAGLHVPMSINVSPRHLQHPGFIEDLEHHVNGTERLQAGDLKLELLESNALEDIEAVSTTIARCRRLGIGFALDDFGTGFSTLSYLKQISADQLKIDQSFVRDMGTDPDDLVILEGVLAMAGAFRKAVIAEGVETEEHGRMLLQLGCSAGQGYAIARPMAADALLAWRERWRPPKSWQRCSPLSGARRDLLRARVEHRAWQLAVVDYLQGIGDAPPEMDHAQCYLGRALAQAAREGIASAGGHLQHCEAMHREVHERARALIAAYRHSGGRTPDGIEAFRAFSRELAGHLSGLLEAAETDARPEEA